MTARGDNEGSRKTIQNLALFLDPSGAVSTFTTAGSIDLTNPFFQSLGTNGRSCGSCHLPGDGWTIAPPHIRNALSRPAALSFLELVVSGGRGNSGAGHGPVLRYFLRST